MRDLGLLIIRLTTGGLLTGHGSQKLFGWFGGHGLQGTSNWLESIGLRPGCQFALMVGIAEFTGGLLKALGLFWPIGPILTFGPMAVATGTVHAGKPIWVAEGGAELPVTNMSTGLGLMLTGPGRFSLDRLLGIRVPGTLVVLAMAVVAASTLMTLSARVVPEMRPAVVPAQGQETVGVERREGERGRRPRAA